MIMPTVPPMLIGQPSLPDLRILKVPADQVPLRRARARGVQIYPWDPETQTFGPAHPKAILVTDQGEIIHHSKGPTWEAADGSLVMGTVLQKVPAPDPDAIPWLLLATKPGDMEYGLLSKVSYIQRVYTKYGNAPPSGPDESAEIPVFYEAEYYFYIPGD
jgi:hypothetical protein